MKDRFWGKCHMGGGGVDFFVVVAIGLGFFSKRRTFLPQEVSC